MGRGTVLGLSITRFSNLDYLCNHGDARGRKLLVSNLQSNSLLCHMKLSSGTVLNSSSPFSSSPICANTKSGIPPILSLPVTIVFIVFWLSFGLMASENAGRCPAAASSPNLKGTTQRMFACRLMELVGSYCLCCVVGRCDFHFLNSGRKVATLAAVMPRPSSMVERMAMRQVSKRNSCLYSPKVWP